MKLSLVYLFIINAVSFLLMLIDKYNARKKRKRISERTLFLAALTGGSLGGLLGMYTVRHKTKHWQFFIGIPVILAVQIFLIIFVYYG